ncbi:MAG: deoxyguanosinetriphosphate triphosphohydrolase [Fimbriimonadaceae bacterium]|nr:deoxyguanosinetriphosphate triphosphohydrolase [Fimbriimonadaceae bacterium]
MHHPIRHANEAREAEVLAPQAARAADSRGRPRPEEPDPIRTCWQRDRDRVLHSKPFRRLKHKTQVFVDPVGDHYRTRLTHTLEVAQVARTIGRALRLNEDLIEAIALAHDLGHPPFGHSGEEALDRAIRKVGDPNLTGFRHDEQSLRVVDVLADLNLTEEVRAGISGHSKGRRDLGAGDGEVKSTLEAAVVRISDRIAYLNHDLDDATRSGMIAGIPERFQPLGRTHSERVSLMVNDLIEQSFDRPALVFSPWVLELLNELKEWLYENVYHRYPEVHPEIRQAQRLVETLFEHFLEPGRLPAGYSGLQGAVDYVSGMTDRFAVEAYMRLFVPTGFTERIARVP